VVPRILTGMGFAAVARVEGCGGRDSRPDAEEPDADVDADRRVPTDSPVSSAWDLSSAAFSTSAVNILGSEVVWANLMSVVA
jgi:hypothetical protein